MAATIFQACASATGGFEYITSTGGTVSFDTATKRSSGSQGSWKLNTGAGPAAAFLVKNTVLDDAGRRYSAWFNFPSVTPAANTIFVAAKTAAAAFIIRVFLNTTGTLSAEPVGAAIVSGSTVLSPNTWYRISLSYKITNATTYDIRLYINGAIEVSITNSGTLTNTVTSQLIPAQIAAAAGANFLMYTDEFYLDDGTDLADVGVSRGSSTNNQLGVTRKAPAQNGNVGYDTGVGASPANRYTNVNEVPISVTNGWSQAGTSQALETYGLQGPTDGDVDLTNALIVSRTAWIWAKAAVGGTGTPGIFDDGAVTAITLTNAAALYTKITDGATFPANIGMQSTGDVNDSFLYECGTVISYIANAAPQARGFLA